MRWSFITENEAVYGELEDTEEFSEQEEERRVLA
jgi:hypothetical protein